jgi:hypothetical protein
MAKAPFGTEYQVELRQFAKDARASSQRAFAIDSVLGGAGPLCIPATDRTWAAGELRPVINPGNSPTDLPYIARHTAKIHTLITLGVGNRTKPLVLKT